MYAATSCTLNLLKPRRHALTTYDPASKRNVMFNKLGDLIVFFALYLIQRKNRIKMW